MSSKGQSLVEAIIALGAAVVIISAIAIAVITSVSNSDFSKNQNLATHFAQQGIEILRGQSESDWTSFATRSGTFCLTQGNSNLGLPTSSCNLPNINNFFIRKVVISPGNAGCSTNTKVSVTVSWSDGKCSLSNAYCHSVLLDTCLANINSISAP